MKNFTVSAIISLFKGEKFIKGRIEDLLAQTLGKEVEIVIVDSNSPQNEKRSLMNFSRVITTSNILEPLKLKVCTLRGTEG
ncbi:MAG: glycosyltransferase [Ignavibacteriales bacterium]|nr:glycosyltransferase [Ignavibacteriales bacterium]